MFSSNKVFSMVIDWLKTEWKNSKLLFFNEIVCAVTGVLSSIYMTITVPNTNFLILYIIYMFDTLSCAITAIYKKSFGLLFNSFVYFIIDTMGIIKILTR